ncbi:nucleoid-associated protein [uncultured Bacteroides sp.]|uniref:nucleoid-associated protein n=1 Tax=uncultured Bacteroides sp. TaxID=162156 RepID=UPI002AA8DEF6|nr:nucleoid-associated protein [uncultured Bacteroides sp.]
MIQFYNASIKECAVHYVGNKNLDEDARISKSKFSLNEEIDYVLTNYFFKSFIQKEDYFNFFHSSDLALNEVYIYISKIFDDPSTLYEQSVNLAKHLYEQSTHPKIKGGEFYVVYFKDCIVDGETVDAVGLFKSENKDTFLKVYPSGDGFEIESERGVNINKLDKGCLIFNIERDNGYLVSVVDNTNKGAEAKYWTEDFLHVRPRRDEFYHTQNVLSLCKSFVSQALPKEYQVSKAEQAILINKSVDALKNGSVNMEQFAKDVFNQPEIVESFNKYKDVYQQERDIELSDSFDVSTQALKKKGTGTMTTIKLDKNFDINIHGGEQYIERGFDKERDMYYYQLFFKEEK